MSSATTQTATTETTSTAAALSGNPPVSNPPLANLLGQTFRTRHDSRVRQANDLIDTLIARAHAPEPTDPESAVDAAMDLIALGQAYSAEQFAADCSAAIQLRTLLAQAHASELERDKLIKEAQQIKHEIDTVHGPNLMPNSSRPIDKRLHHTRQQIIRLDTQHAARHVRFDNLLTTAPRVLRALTTAGLEVRLKRWAPSLAIPRRLNWRPA